MTPDVNLENPLTKMENLLQEAVILNAAYPGADINPFTHLLENALAALEISLDGLTPAPAKAEESRNAAELLGQAAVHAEQIHGQLTANQPDRYAGQEWRLLAQRAYALQNSLQNQSEPRPEQRNQDADSGNAPSRDPDDPLPERFSVLLAPADLRPEVKAGFPPELQHGLRFYAEVTREQYFRLTGDTAGRHVKDRLAVARESA